MVKFVECLIDTPTLVDFARKNIEGCKNCKYLIITDVKKVSDYGCDKIAFQAIVSDEIINRDRGVRFIFR